MGDNCPGFSAIDALLVMSGAFLCAAAFFTRHAVRPSQPLGDTNQPGCWVAPETPLNALPSAAVGALGTWDRVRFLVGGVMGQAGVFCSGGGREIPLSLLVRFEVRFWVRGAVRFAVRNGFVLGSWVRVGFQGRARFPCCSAGKLPYSIPFLAFTQGKKSRKKPCWHR